MNKLKPIVTHTNPVLPADYGDALSYGEMLGKLVYTVNQLIDEIEELNERVQALENESRE